MLTDNTQLKREAPVAGLEMTERECLNCARKFKVMATSKTWTCSHACLVDAENDPAKKKDLIKRKNWVGPVMKPGYPTEKKIEAKTTPPKDVAPVAPPKAKERVLKAVVEAPASPHAEMEAKWQRYVEKARGFVKSMNQHRLEVAKLAVEVCDIQQGGGAHWSDFKDVFTLKQFAEDVGITYKTLHGWCRVLQNVIQKLEPGEYDDKSDYHAAVKVANKSKKGDKPEKIRAEFKKAKARGTQDEQLMQIARRCKSGAYFIHHRAKLERLDEATLRELKHNAQSIVNDINKFFRGEK